ncbi:MAG: RDD family protein [Planctomycetia bacterium]|nr:RDD family protein [Planctomycetia bacterium]
MCGEISDPLERRCRSCGESLGGRAHPGADRDDGAAEPILAPAVSLIGTVLPRHLAAIADNFVAMIVAVGAGAAVPESFPIVRLAIGVSAYLAYYLFFERLISATPGKLLTGIVVVQFDGRPCTWRQVGIRTLLRIVEVNPLLLGGLPAAVCIVSSQNRQRIGDRLAGTIVAPRRLVAKYRRSLQTSGA